MSNIYVILSFFLDILRKNPTCTAEIILGLFDVFYYSRFLFSEILLAVTLSARENSSSSTAVTSKQTPVKLTSADFQRRESPPVLVIASYNKSRPVENFDHQPNTSSASLKIKAAKQ